MEQNIAWCIFLPVVCSIGKALAYAQMLASGLATPSEASGIV